jgi:hypothetical protein
MNDFIVWVIIVAFYAPLHYLLPMLFLFITGSEPQAVRGTLIRRALFDSTLSMVAAFAAAILLAQRQELFTAMLVLLLSMGFPFLRIFRHRREISGEGD